jgi:Family of unknown function (DUF5941)
VTAAETIAGERAGPPLLLEVARDEGPLARLLGRLLAPAVPLPAPTLILLGALPLAAVLASDGLRASDAAAGAAVASLVVGAGVASGRPLGARFGWSVPPLLRLLEYGMLLWLALVAGADGAGPCFALLAALAFRHYDTVYRLRAQRLAPPAWLRLLGGGFDGRLLLAYALVLVGVLPAGFIVGAGALGATSLAESLASWRRFRRAERPMPYADMEQDE